MSIFMRHGYWMLWLSLTMGCIASAEERRDLDLVLCLDSSSSMDGLIDSAKQRLWDVVNEAAKIRPAPNLRVALYHYGNNGLSAETGWVERLSPFTSDLDALYDRLFAIRTGGGTEYVARVTMAALRELEWSKQPDALRLLYVAGNEPATQDGRIPLADACRAARIMDVVVNAIHCGPEAVGRQSGWADAAAWGGGRYAAIDQDHGVVAVPTPFDEPLAKLTVELNLTYIPYGAEDAREHYSHNQVAQDMNSLANAPAGAAYANAASRAASRASGLYRNAHWDLVDAVKEKRLTLDEAAALPAEQLPDEFRKLTPAERRARIQTARTKRETLQQTIRDLDAKRQQAIREEMKLRRLDDGASLDAQLRRSLREQAKARGFHFAEK